jgi:hypothetical protein
VTTASTSLQAQASFLVASRRSILHGNCLTFLGNSQSQ